MLPIRVPARLANLRVIVSGEIAGLADGREQTVEAERSWDLGGIRESSQVHDALLTRDGDSFMVDVRGRNGEIVPRATVSIAMTTDLCNRPIDVTLQTDDQGRVRLGRLDGVRQIRFSVASGLHHVHDLQLNRVRWPSEVHTTAQGQVRLPLADPSVDVRSRYRLLELRDGRYKDDHSDQLSAENGLLVVRPLAAGDYHLIDRSTAETTLIAVVDGPEVDRVAVGKTRHRSITAAVPLSIASITRDEQAVKIQLSGHTETARVHVYGLQYFDSESPMERLVLPFPRLWGRRVVRPPSAYVSDLRLGDEYEYVLRRRYAEKFPGVMLPQPGIILNPWETEETTNASQSVREGEAPPPAAAAEAMDSAARKLTEESRAVPTGASDFDFLADPGVVLANLRPDQDGVVTVPRDLVEGLPILQIVACDAATVMQRTFTDSSAEVETTDLRLSQSLDPSKAFSLKRGVTIASPDQPLDLKQLASAQLQLYTSVADLLKLHKTMVDDERLADFDLLGNWGSLERPAKLEAYARLASHEMHLFLWSHDRPFFEEVIAPYLANKKEKQFVDLWLLELDLTPYTQLWRYNQLNAAERALLAVRLPEFREAVLRDLRETIESQEPDPEAIRKGIEIALRGQRLDTEVDFAEAMVESGPAAADDKASSWMALGDRRRELSRRGCAKQQADFGFRGGAPNVQLAPTFTLAGRLVAWVEAPRSFVIWTAPNSGRKVIGIARAWSVVRIPRLGLASMTFGWMWLDRIRPPRRFPRIC